MPKEKFDFGGYATKNGLKCSDGRVILKDAFAHQDGAIVPLVWSHLHNEPSNILGHALLENRSDGVYCYGKFNNSENGKNAKELVHSGDITFLSIYANKLQEESKRVKHGAICEVSLVVAGANPGAKIDNLSFAHGDSDDVEIDETEAIITTGLVISHGEDTTDVGDKKTVDEIFETLNDEQKALLHSVLNRAKTDPATPGEEKELEHASDETVGDIIDTLNDKQKAALYYLLDRAISSDNAGPAEHSNTSNKGEDTMKTNPFDKATQNEQPNTLSHEQKLEILKDAKSFGSLKESFIAHATDYGFNPIDILFPDAKDVISGAPVTIKRDTSWVNKVLGKAKHTPFSRIRTRVADLTADEARAKGYVTGNLKKEQIIPLLKRSTTPTTIYKKQKLDRDDFVDITDFDVVVYLKAEMREMLDEEIARAALISDGRSDADEDKINELNIRPIIKDDPNVFIHRVQVANDMATDSIIDEFIRARKYYKGSGNPDLYISTDLLTEMLLLKDQFGHRLYKTTQELASVLRVNEIVEVEPMNTAVRTVGDDSFEILGIVVNMQDYTFGADKGGQVAMFDDFDIDYNQLKYLIETRCSGALTMPKSALVFERLPAVAAG